MTPEVAKYRWLIHLGWTIGLIVLVAGAVYGFRLWVDLQRYEVQAQEPRVITVPASPAPVVRGKVGK